MCATLRPGTSIRPRNAFAQPVHPLLQLKPVPWRDCGLQNQLLVSRHPSNLPSPSHFPFSEPAQDLCRSVSSTLKFFGKTTKQLFHLLSLTGEVFFKTNTKIKNLERESASPSTSCSGPTPFLFLFLFPEGGCGCIPRMSSWVIFKAPGVPLRMGETMSTLSWFHPCILRYFSFPWSQKHPHSPKTSLPR